jgi:hypothetical protein
LRSKKQASRSQTARQKPPAGKSCEPRGSGCKAGSEPFLKRKATSTSSTDPKPGPGHHTGKKRGHMDILVAVKIPGRKPGERIGIVKFYEMGY